LPLLLCVQASSTDSTSLGGRQKAPACAGLPLPLRRPSAAAVMIYKVLVRATAEACSVAALQCHRNSKPICRRRE
jgi:hypothetical protein